MRILSLAILLVSSVAIAAESERIQFPLGYDGRALPFVAHEGPGEFDNALAVNLPNEPIADLRNTLVRYLDTRLDFFRKWNPKGEAHVTIITPPEFWNILRPRGITIQQIAHLAMKRNVQSADISVLAVGSGKKWIDGIQEETYFLIVESQTLRLIRQDIGALFRQKGGTIQEWNPARYFPHITIGYTKEDLHEPDIIKNMEKSFDRRFYLRRE